MQMIGAFEDSNYSKLSISDSPSYYAKGVTTNYAKTYHQSRFNPSRK